MARRSLLRPSILSLNEDVLSKILSFLLLDTPRERNRTSILRTCSTLHRLGFPFLYRVVDLTRLRKRKRLVKHWRVLFGDRGLLSPEGGKKEVGMTVRELRMGFTLDDEFLYTVPSLPGFDVLRAVNLPNCTSLLLDFTMLHYSCGYPPLPLFVTQLPIHELFLRWDPINAGLHDYDEGLVTSHGDWEMEVVVGLADRCQPEQWTPLDVLTVEYGVWYQGIPAAGTLPRRFRLAFFDWSVKVLRFRFLETDDVQWHQPDRTPEGEELVALFFDVERDEQSTFLLETERIEFRGDSEEELQFRMRIAEEQFRKEVEKRRKVGMSEFVERIASLIVFVNEDETERRLIEEEATS